jgi:protein TonB
VSCSSFAEPAPIWGFTPGESAQTAIPISGNSDSYRNYWNAVNLIVAQSVVFPSQASGSGCAGTAKVRVHIRADGAVLRVQLMQSSGVGILDQEALDVFRRIAKFPPVLVKDPTYTVYVFEMPIIFELK